MSDPSAIEQLRESMQGEIILPDDASYDHTRAVWNGMIDKRPAIIARCESENDVIASVRFARQNDLPVSIRGGGHGVAGRAVADGALLIDMSPMGRVAIDRQNRVATVQAGALLGDLDKAAQEQGLVTTAGIDPRTGVAGLTLGGGFGFLARRYGLTIDNLLAAELVNADGEHIRASQSENPDLLWALKGGGGNFGVVTMFEFKLHEFGPDVHVAMVYYPVEQTTDALRICRDQMIDAPDDLTIYP
ncbi:MAG: FAD-binding oxidoreductase, partial [Planctomycetota bacterium]